MFGNMSRMVLVCLLATVVLVGCGGSSNEELKLGGIDLGEVLEGLVARTQQTLAKVQDQSTALAAADELKLIGQDFDDLAYHVPKLPPQGQVELAKTASRNLGQMEDLARFVNGNAGLREILGEQMNVLVEKMKGLTAL